jgi:hypothetical protein
LSELKVIEDTTQVSEKLIEPQFEDFDENNFNIARPKKAKETHKKWPKLSNEVLDLHKQLNLSNPGHNGKAVILPSTLPIEIEEKVKKSWEIYSINEFVSNLVPLDRDLPDVRPEYCKQIQYSPNLPQTSVIMVFHNEPLSMILRSVFAVFMRTPRELLKEVVLIDDCSTHGNF